MDNYLIYLQQYYNYKNASNKICKKCKNKLIFKETKLKNGVYKLELSCDNELPNSCGTQFVIKLPKYKDLFKEIEILKQKLNTGYNYEILSKYIDVDDKKKDNSITIEKIEELNKIFEDINEIEEKYLEIDNLFNNQKEIITNQNNLINEIKEDINTSDKKRIIAKYLENNKLLKENYNTINLMKKSITKFTLDKIKPYLVKGAIILFDELYNYPGWRNGEYKALTEVFKEDEFKYKAFLINGAPCAIQIT